MLLAHKKTGLPFAEGLEACVNLPHTITTAITFSARIESFNELPKDKRPPRGIWDKPHALDEFFETVFGSSGVKTKIIDIDNEEVE